MPSRMPKFICCADELAPLSCAWCSHLGMVPSSGCRPCGAAEAAPAAAVRPMTVPLQVADLPVAVLLVLAMSSIGVYGIVLAGGASGSPYSLLGTLRSAAQVISYEIARALSSVAVFLYAGSLT